MTDSGGPGGSFTEIGFVTTDSFLPMETKHSAWLISALIFALISLAGLLLSLLRYRCKTDYDFESLAAIEIATLPHSGSRSKTMDDDHPDALLPAAHTNPSIGIRRRIAGPIGLRQEVQDEISVGDQSFYEEGVSYPISRFLSQPVYEEGLSHPISRFLSQPGRGGTIRELH